MEFFQLRTNTFWTQTRKNKYFIPDDLKIIVRYDKGERVCVIVHNVSIDPRPLNPQGWNLA